MRPTRWLQHLPPPLLVEDTVSGILGAGKTLAQRDGPRGSARQHQGTPERSAGGGVVGIHVHPPCLVVCLTITMCLSMAALA